MGKILLSGRGTHLNPTNQYETTYFTREHTEGLDASEALPGKTVIMHEQAKTIVNRVDSPDIPYEYSVNPYRGCEHGCIYCYARNSHEYAGYSAGLDFERKIFVKTNAAALLESKFRHPLWKGTPIMLSGNTDCYQPIEKKYRITRQLLDVCLRFRNPVGIISKNDLILRDSDLLEQLAALDLVHIVFSMTSLDDALRRRMEPRTATVSKRFKAMKALSSLGVPVSVMMAPVIPGLNENDIAGILKTAADNGARSAAYTLIRLNGHLPVLFESWLRIHYPLRAERVLGAIASCRGGQLGDKKFGRRMRGEGPVADVIHQLFKQARRKYLPRQIKPKLRTDLFCPPNGRQMKLF